MAYATEVRVEALMGQFPISDSSKPTTTQVAVIIGQVDALVDAALATQGLTVPVTAPAYFLEFVTGWSTNGVVAQVLRSGFPDVIGPGEQPAFRYWQRLFDDVMVGIKSGDLIPADAVRAGIFVAPSTYLTRNPDENEDLGDIAEPLFKRDTIF